MIKSKVFERNNGIDMLRIIAMLLVFMYHTAFFTHTIIDYENISSVNSVLLWLSMRIGFVGDIIFITCSSWFLIDYNSKKKFNKAKPIIILLDSMAVSIIILIVYSFINKGNVDPKLVISNIFPDIYRNVWFVPCYVIFYCASPLLNKSLCVLNRKTHLLLCCLIYFFYGILGVFSLQPEYNNMIGFIGIFYIVAYFKRYAINLENNKKLCLMLAMLFLFVYVLALVFLNSEIFDFNFLLNPLMVPMCLFLLFFMKETNVNNKYITSISSITLYAYIIHNNILISKVWPKLSLLLLTKYNNVVLTLIIEFVIMSSASIALGLLYKHTIHRIVINLGDKVLHIIEKVLDKVS